MPLIGDEWLCGKIREDFYESCDSTLLDIANARRRKSS
jgi:hypothetical protein